MSKSNLYIIGFLLLFNSCGEKNKNQSQVNDNKLLTEIHSIVDSISSNLPLHYSAPLYTVTYEKKENREYIKVSTAEYFNKDSVSTYEIYNNYLLIFYAKDFFKNKLDTLKTQGLEFYEQSAYKEETVSLYHPQYEVLEILEDDKFRILPMKEHQEQKLFYFDDRYIPEPTPTDSLLKN